MDTTEMLATESPPTSLAEILEKINRAVEGFSGLVPRHHRQAIHNILLGLPAFVNLPPLRKKADDTGMLKLALPTADGSKFFITSKPHAIQDFLAITTTASETDSEEVKNTQRDLIFSAVAEAATYGGLVKFA